MVSKKCVASVKGAGKKLTDGEAEALADALEREMRLEGITSSADVGRAANQIIDDFISKKKVALNQRKREVFLAQLAERRILDKVNRFKKATGASDDVAYSAVLVGRTIKGTDAGENVDGLQKARTVMNLGRLMGRLFDEDLLDLFSSKTLDEEIHKELYELGRGATKTVTGQHQARRIAEIVSEEQKRWRQDTNRAGGLVSEVKGYTTSQTYDGATMLQAGLDAFKAAAKQHWDMKATLKAADFRLDPNKSLDQIWDEFIDEFWYNKAHGQKFDETPLRSKDPLESAFRGPANLAKRVSQDRVIVFKDGDSFYRFHRDYGVGDGFADRLVADIEAISERTVLMEQMGPNPELMHRRVVGKIANRSRKTDPKAFENLRNAVGGPETHFAQVSGQTRAITKLTRAQIVSDVQALQSMAKLGGATLGSFGDIANASAELNFNGMTYGQAVFNQVRTAMRASKQKEVRRVLLYAGQGLDGQLGRIYQRVGGADSVSTRSNGMLKPGWLSSKLDYYFKLNLLAPWTDAQSAGIGRALSRFLGDESGKAFSKLHPDTQNTLGISGIDEFDWDIIRQHGVGDIDGQRWIMTDLVDAVDDAVLRDGLAKRNDVSPDTLTQRQVDVYRRDLGTRIRLYLLNASDRGVAKPGARERSILYGQSTTDDVGGIVRRLIMQFKAFPVTTFTRGFERETLGRGGGLGRLNALRTSHSARMGLLKWATFATAAGYMSNWALDIASNREPRDIDSVETFVDAFVRGGALTIFGDFFFAEANRFGGGLWSTTLGPTAGTVEDFAKVVGSARDLAIGKEGAGDPAAQLGRAVQNVTPGQNLFYLKATLDMMLFSQYQEFVNPGYNERRRIRLLKEDQDFIYQPPNLVR